MEFFDVVTSSIWVVLSSVVPFLAVLTLIVFVHEYGHFKVARWCGVGIETFAVGFAARSLVKPINTEPAGSSAGSLSAAM